MPRNLLHLEEADLPAAGVHPGLLRSLRPFLATALDERRGLAILAPPTEGTREILMVLARRIGAALRDENIRQRERGEDLKRGRKKLCYLPGSHLAEAVGTPATRNLLVAEAACFIQDLETAWIGDMLSSTRLATDALHAVLDARLAAGRPTFVSAAPAELPASVERGLRDRLRILELPGAR